MDTITTQVLALIDTLTAEGSVRVSHTIAKPFYQAARDMHLLVCGGALDLDNNGQWFYLDR